MKFRFLIIFFKSWTYEITQVMEWFRLSTIQALFITYILIQRFLIGFQSWALWVSVFVVIHWWLYTWFSVSRLLQIKQNKKEAIVISSSLLYKIQESYPKEDCYLFLDGKYIKLKAGEKLNLACDELTLIRVGKKPLSDRRKIKKLMQNKV